MSPNSAHSCDLVGWPPLTLPLFAELRYCLLTEILGPDLQNILQFIVRLYYVYRRIDLR